MPNPEKKELKAIHTTDLTEILKKFGQLDDFVQDKISCIICKTKITKENVGSIKFENEKLLFTCNKSSCYNEIVQGSLNSE